MAESPATQWLHRVLAFDKENPWTGHPTEGDEDAEATNPPQAKAPRDQLRGQPVPRARKNDDNEKG